MMAVRLPLQLRIVAVIGGALVVVQLMLANSFLDAIAIANQDRESSYRQAALGALEAAVADRMQSDRARLELFADLGRQQQTEIQEAEVSREKPAPEREATGFWQRLFSGPAVQATDDAAARAEPQSRPRLTDKVRDVVEYRDAWPAIWYLKTSGLPNLSPDLRAAARRIESETVGFAARWRCLLEDCFLLSVRPFQTQDQKQIVAVSAISLAEAIVQLGRLGNHRYRWSIGAGRSHASHPALDQIGGVPVEGEPLNLAAGPVAPSATLQTIRDTYISLAVSGLLVSLLLLALSLRAVLQRIASLANALPALAKGRFDQVQTLLHAQQKPAWLIDETHDLVSLAASVSEQLRALNAQLEGQAAELRQERDQMAVLLNTVPAAVVSVDAEMAVQSANSMMAKLVRTEPEALQNRDLREVILEADREAFAHAARVCLGSGTMREVEAQLQGRGPDSPDPRTVRWRLMRTDAQQRVKILAVGLDVTQQREAERRLHWLSEHDQVTGFLNRQATVRELSAQIESRAVVVLRIRAEQAEAMRDHAREQFRRDVATHLRDFGHPAFRVVWGSLAPELYVGLAVAPQESVEPWRQELVGMLAAATFECGGQPGRAEVRSVATALIDLQAERDIAQILEAAARLLEQDDSAGWLTPQRMLEQVKEDLHYWTERVSEALADDRMLLHYQPIYACDSLVPSHSEALIRMVDESGSLVPPGKFIPHCERSGQILEIERRVFSLAIEKLLSLQKQGVDHGIAVNLAAQSLRDQVLIEMIEAAVSERGLKPESLMLEIVETQAIENLDAAVELMLRFKELGLRIALDDFGVGFTSFEYLRELPFDYVKIDQLFVRQLAEREDDQQLIASINGMVHSLGKKTIAEGIEDAESLRILKEIGVDAVQGYALNRPAPELMLDPLRPLDTGNIVPLRRPKRSRQHRAAQ